ncbi:MAG: phycocyanobilin:ferredoxin oxidoreductase [Aphanocapsa feldmannii 288cV]|nr:MAG: phycocyanobilin:ferredoxin oxidoreductase [Aphanocapsa feldmannii 288cV]
MIPAFSTLRVRLERLFGRNGVSSSGHEGLSARTIACFKACNDHDLVSALSQGILKRWRQLDGLAVLPIPPGFAEIHGRFDGKALLIRNVCFSAQGFRKLHLEVANLGPGLNILHCVMFPDHSWDLPLFGCDIVTARGRVTAAVVDLSPTAAALDGQWLEALAPLRRFAYATPRDLPEWGSIFSAAVCFVRPGSAEEENAFLRQSLGYLDALLNRKASIIPDGSDDPASLARLEGQRRYCRQQQCNDKTRRVLAKAFDDSWADRYIRELLFDSPQVGAA